MHRKLAKNFLKTSEGVNIQLFADLQNWISYCPSAACYCLVLFPPCLHWWYTLVVCVWSWEGCLITNLLLNLLCWCVHWAGHQPLLGNMGRWLEMVCFIWWRMCTSSVCWFSAYQAVCRVTFREACCFFVCVQLCGSLLPLCNGSVGLCALFLLHSSSLVSW